jgi:hypothetical protein
MIGYHYADCSWRHVSIATRIKLSAGQVATTPNWPSAAPTAQKIMRGARIAPTSNENLGIYYQGLG